jgi:hypothetical protein
MTKFSRGNKTMAIAKNPKQVIKKSPVKPRGLDVLQKTVGNGINCNGIGQTKALVLVAKNNNENEEECFKDEYDKNESLSNITIYLYFQELLYGLELLNNAFIYYYKQYLIDVIRSVKNDDIDFISNMSLCKENISIFLTLQSEYQNLYNNKMKHSKGPYDIGEANTMNIFKSKGNNFYATYIFLKDSKGSKLINKIKNYEKYKKLQYNSRFLSVCDNVQENYINASKAFVNFINNEFQTTMRVMISASRDNGHTNLDFKKCKENLQDYSSDKMTKSNILNIIKEKWKLDNESSTYNNYINNEIKEVVSCIKPINLAKTINSNDDQTPLNVSFSKLNDLCAVVTAARDINPSPIMDGSIIPIIQDDHMLDASTIVSSVNESHLVNDSNLKDIKVKDIKEASHCKVIIFTNYSTVFVFMLK